MDAKFDALRKRVDTLYNKAVLLENKVNESNKRITLVSVDEVDDENSFDLVNKLIPALRKFGVSAYSYGFGGSTGIILSRDILSYQEKKQAIAKEYGVDQDSLGEEELGPENDTKTVRKAKDYNPNTLPLVKELAEMFEDIYDSDMSKFNFFCESHELKPRIISALKEFLSKK